jgi:hypothetical protein
MWFRRLGQGYPPNINQLTTLHVKLGRVAKSLRIWSRSLLPQIKLVMVVCREVIQQLEIV